MRTQDLQNYLVFDGGPLVLLDVLCLPEVLVAEDDVGGQAGEDEDHGGDDDSRLLELSSRSGSCISTLMSSFQVRTDVMVESRMLVPPGVSYHPVLTSWSNM